MGHLYLRQGLALGAVIVGEEAHHIADHTITELRRVPLRRVLVLNVPKAEVLERLGNLALVHGLTHHLVVGWW